MRETSRPHNRTSTLFTSSKNHFFRLLARLAARTLTRVSVRGVENIPPSGGLLLTMNHLGGADPVLVVGFTPRPVAALGKIEALSWPILGAVVRAYGMIPVRRGEVDRVMLTAALDVLRASGALLIAPEGRESRTGALEETKAGAGFLAVQAGVPILPVAITGTAWKNVLDHWRRFRRPYVTLTFGQPYYLPPENKRREAAELIIRQIAGLLPPEYRGVYA